MDEVQLFPIVVIIIFLLWIKHVNDKWNTYERELRRHKGRIRSMIRKGWKVSEDSQDGIIKLYKPRKRKTKRRKSKK